MWSGNCFTVPSGIYIERIGGHNKAVPTLHDEQFHCDTDVFRNGCLSITNVLNGGVRYT
jgi:hypothetical protein